MVLSLHLAIPSTSSSQIVFFRESNEPDYNEDRDQLEEEQEQEQGEQTGETSSSSTTTTTNQIF
jgi:hypothetical protein